MKKLTILIGALCVFFGLVIVGTVLFEKKMDEDEEFMIKVLDLAHNNDDNINKNSSSQIETEVSEKNVQIKNSTEVAENPEKNLEGFDELRMDAVLSDEDWQVRIDAGLDTVSLNNAIKGCEGLYYFDLLDPFGKQLYLEMLIVLQKFESNVCLCSLDEDKIDSVFLCVLYDHPEIYYTNGYLLTRYLAKEEVVRLGFSPMYTMEEEYAQECQKYVDEYTANFLSGIDRRFASDYEKVKYTYEFVILNTEYDIDSEDNQSIISVMLNKKSVCQGYARTVQYLLSKLDVPATVVSGYDQNGEGHAWNLVKCNNAYYYVDATWGDSSFNLSSNYSEISYDYLNITTAELEKNHVIDNIAEVPLCMFTSDNYYVKEGLYFNSVNDEKLKEAFNNAYDDGRSFISIKCSNSMVFEDIRTYLIDDNHIFDYIRGKSSLDYFVNEDLLTYLFDI